MGARSHLHCRFDFFSKLLAMKSLN